MAFALLQQIIAGYNFSDPNDSKEMKVSAGLLTKTQQCKPAHSLEVNLVYNMPNIARNKHPCDI
jgi:hypothetical protein